MKKQAILIQCHNGFELINCIINFMPENMFDFYIHVDKKSSIQEQIEHKENVFFVEDRVDVRWGRYSQVEATIMLLKAMRKPKEYSYCHLISGNDFFVKSSKWFMEEFSENNNLEYIQSNYLDGSSTWSWGGLDRFQCYYPQWIIQRPANKCMRLLRVLYREFIMRTKLFRRRKYPVEKFYGGSSWWSLTGSMVQWMREYLERHPEYCEHFKHGVCVDEVFFSTLVRYSPYRDNIINQHMRYMIWDSGINTGGPAELDIQNVDDIINSEYAFARKIVDKNVMEAVMNKLRH